MTRHTSRLKLIITGTGRCGTVFMARFLTSAGIPCGHECIFTPLGLEEAKIRLSNPDKRELSHCSSYDVLTGKKNPEWINLKSIVAESSYMSAPFLNNPILKNVSTIHLMRHPLDVISSFVYGGNFFLENQPRNDEKVYVWEKFINSNMKEVFEEKNPIDRAAFFVYGWNVKIRENLKNKLNIVHFIENGITPKLIDFLNVHDDTNHFNSKINSWNTNYKIIEWKDISKHIRNNLINLYEDMKKSSENE